MASPDTGDVTVPVLAVGGIALPFVVALVFFLVVTIPLALMSLGILFIIGFAQFMS